MKRYTLALLALMFCAPAFAATVDSGTHVVTPDCVESPCDSYRFAPFCTDANRDGICDGYSAKTWTQSSAITSVPAACNAGDNATANPDVNPVFSATGLPTGLAISSTTGAITGTPTGIGNGAIVVTCANDLGSRTDSLTYTINPSGGAAVLATGYFVDPVGGLDTNNGTSPQTAWKTVGKVNGATLPVGTDIWFLAGTTSSSAALGIDWSGTATDPVIVGTYYVSGGVAYQDTPTNYGISIRPRNYVYGNGARAILRGTYNDSCRNAYDFQTSANKCAWNTADATYRVAGTAFPTSRSASMIEITGKFVVLQDIEVDDSAGRGVQTNFGSWCLGNSAACQFQAIIQRVKTNGTATAGILIKYVSQVVVRQSEVTRDNLECGDRMPGTQTAIRCESGIGISGSSPSQVLLEGNDVHDGWGEAHGPYGVSYVLIRGEEVANHVAPLNMGGGANLVAEQNITVSGDVIDKAAGLTGYRSGGVHPDAGLSYENPSTPTVADYSIGAIPGSATLVRNNLTAGWGYCVNSYLTAALSTATGTSFDYSYLGNVCIMPNASGSAINFSSITDFTKLNFIRAADNLFVPSSAAIAGSAPTTGKDTFDHNQWSISPTDADLRTTGTGDVYSATTGLGAFNFTTVSLANFPASSDFKPTAGAGANVATTLTSAAAGATSTNWDWVISQRQWLPTCNVSGAQVSRTEWNKLLTTNFCGDARDGTPDMGAF